MTGINCNRITSFFVVQENHVPFTPSVNSGTHGLAPVPEFRSMYGIRAEVLVVIPNTPSLCDSVEHALVNVRNDVNIPQRDGADRHS